MNRPSQFKRFSGAKIYVLNWEEAQTALKDAGITPINEMEKASVILMGTGRTSKDWDKVLKLVYKGTSLIVQFGEVDANMLYAKGLINKPIESWGGVQTPFWDASC